MISNKHSFFRFLIVQPDAAVRHMSNKSFTQTHMPSFPLIRQRDLLLVVESQRSCCLSSKATSSIYSLASSKCQNGITITTNDSNGMERSRDSFTEEDLRDIDAVGFLLEEMKYFHRRIHPLDPLSSLF